ncbi:hypothetical protein [Spelaeicoccus albus]|uniref:Uncharacterized protein n=1 Tax=Spelaeicoccus albus TaxID=1280376 RepID=A0A7Z0CZD2_9MICO|nr:hypothetical protein [Spelaeicoccus albus]NYI66159.1 hypothetical protein [Spelaeicoccus albus]
MTRNPYKSDTAEPISPHGRYAVWVGVAGVLVSLLTGLAQAKIVVAGGSPDSAPWMTLIPGMLGAAALAWGWIVVARKSTGREMGAAAIGLGAFVLTGTLAQVAAMTIA